MILRVLVVLSILCVASLVHAHDSPNIKKGFKAHIESPECAALMPPWHVNPEHHYHYSHGDCGRSAVSSCLLPGYIEETDDWDFSLATCEGFGVELERDPPPTRTSTRSPHVQAPIAVVATPPPSVRQPPIIESPILEERMNDAPVIGTMPSPREPLRYTMTFPAGITSLHLPIKPRNIYFTDLFKMLGADNVNSLEALRPTVQAWTIVRSVNSRQNEWISEYRGFVADMSESVTIELMQEAPKSDYGYSMMYLKEGQNLVGVPRQSEMLETVENLFNVFSGVVSVKGLTSASNEWIELDDDTEISGETGYLLQCTEGSERAIWGVLWSYEETVSAAPGIEQWVHYKKMATTWGAIKQ